MTTKKEPAKRGRPKKCKHEIAEPSYVIRLTSAIYERGACALCGARGQYVTKMAEGKEITEWEDL